MKQRKSQTPYFHRDCSSRFDPTVIKIAFFLEAAAAPSQTETNAFNASVAVLQAKW